LQDAKLPIHIVTTDLVSGDSVVLVGGVGAEAIIRSTAIPALFRSVRTRIFSWPTADLLNTPIRVAWKGSDRLIFCRPVCLRHARASDRRVPMRCMRDAADRAAMVSELGRPRPRHRILRCAAIMSAGGFAL